MDLSNDTKIRNRIKSERARNQGRPIWLLVMAVNARDRGSWAQIIWCLLQTVYCQATIILEKSLAQDETYTNAVCFARFIMSKES